MEIPGNEIVVDKYLKVWYQFAATPQWYEPAGSYNIRAQYERDANGNITVRNTLQYRGKSKSISGFLVPTSTPGKFKVKLERAILWFTITADYDVQYVYADENGEYVAAIVGDDKYTYVLCDSLTPSCDLQAKITARLGAEKVKKLNFTAQVC